MAMSHQYTLIGLSLLFSFYLILPVSSNSVKNGSEDTQVGRIKNKVNYRYLCVGNEEDGSKSVKNIGVACKCPSIYAPVCGSDNVTYHNRCYMHCRAKHAKDLYHKYRLVLKKFGEC